MGLFKLVLTAGTGEKRSFYTGSSVYKGCRKGKNGEVGLSEGAMDFSRGDHVDDECNGIVMQWL